MGFSYLALIIIVNLLKMLVFLGIPTKLNQGVINLVTVEAI